MTRLAPNYRKLTLELVLNDARITSEVITRLARSLNLAIGERPNYEYVKLMSVKKEAANARETINA